MQKDKKAKKIIIIDKKTNRQNRQKIQKRQKIKKLKDTYTGGPHTLHRS